MALIESGFAHPAKAEELTAAAMAIDADALLTSCNAGNDKKTKLKEEEIVVPGMNTPPDTPDEDSPSPPGVQFNRNFRFRVGFWDKFRGNFGDNFSTRKLEVSKQNSKHE